MSAAPFNIGASLSSLSESISPTINADTSRAFNGKVDLIVAEIHTGWRRKFNGEVRKQLGHLDDDLAKFNRALLRSRDFLEEQIYDSPYSENLDQFKELDAQVASGIKKLERDLRSLRIVTPKFTTKRKWLMKMDGIWKQQKSIERLVQELFRFLDSQSVSRHPTKGALETLEFGQRDTLLPQALKGLKLDDYLVQQSEISSRCVLDTRSWLFNDAGFQDWLKNPGRALLCTGLCELLWLSIGFDEYF
jgi:hypothetical protein